MAEIPSVPDDAVNRHGTCLLVGDRGVAISGPSGSGKSALAVRLLARARASHMFARLVCDDRMWLSVRHGRIVCRAPEQIAGMIELRGAGIATVEHEPSCVIGLWICLAPEETIERLPEAGTVFADLPGASVPCLRLPSNRNTDNAETVFTALGFA